MLIGKTLNKYTIIEHVGSGGMADVYKAYHPGLDCNVAIKVLHSFLATEEDFLTRFQREARIVASFRHPNIVQVHDFDFDADNNAYYMVMEFVDGPNLKTRLQEMAREGQIMPLDEAVHIVTSVANALEYAHQRGMVHRDVKPANIMFTRDGEVILSDFGIARMVNTTTLTASGAMVGTPAYIAPEQGIGKTGDERSDIYSLGAVLYQLVTGSLPFDADTPLGIVLKHINAPLTPPTTLNPDLPPGIEAVITRALAKDPDDRYQTAKEFAADLERAAAGEHIEPISPELATVSDKGETIPSPPGQIKQLGVEAASPGASATPPHPVAPVSRPKWGRLVMAALVLAVALLVTVALITAETPYSLLVALFPGTATPRVTLPPSTPPTLTPNMTATHNALATQVAVGIEAALRTRDAMATRQATATPSPTFTPTPDRTATAVAACEFDLQIVTDRAISPSVLRPGQQFVKRWTVKNSGSCIWPDDVRLVFVSGDELEVVTEPEIEPLSPGETAEMRLTLRAPAAYDSYTSVWQLQYGEEKPIGEKLVVTCRVSPPPTRRPTATPTVTPSPEASPTPAGTPTPIFAPQIVRYSLDRWRLDPETRTWYATVTLHVTGGDGHYVFYLNQVSESAIFVNGSELSAEKCKPIMGTFYVTSAGQVSKKEFWIPYPDQPDCE